MFHKNIFFCKRSSTGASSPNTKIFALVNTCGSSLWISASLDHHRNADTCLGLRHIPRRACCNGGLVYFFVQHHMHMSVLSFPFIQKDEPSDAIERDPAADLSTSDDVFRCSGERGKKRGGRGENEGRRTNKAPCLFLYPLPANTHSWGWSSCPRPRAPPLRSVSPFHLLSPFREEPDREGRQYIVHKG